jgi:branched-subunit amino acid transport protein
MGAGSFLLRFSFLGLIGNRPMPDWLLRHLRYTAVAFIPALIIPLTTFRDDGALDGTQIAAGLVTLGISYWTKNVFVSILLGAGCYVALLMLFG